MHIGNDPWLQVKDLTKFKDNKESLFEDVNFTIDKGDVAVVVGPSGAGKTTLLKCLAELVPYDNGVISFNGLTANELSYPVWRTHVLYVPQRPALLPGTPRDLWDRLTNLKSWNSKESEKAFRNRFGVDGNTHKHSWNPFRRNSSSEPSATIPTTVDIEAPQSSNVDDNNNNNTSIPGDPIELGHLWNLSPSLFDQEWQQLSGGEAQRAALAISVALMVSKRGSNGVLLLDEPTSALDYSAVLQVEKTLLGLKKTPSSTPGESTPQDPMDSSSKSPLTILWITHSVEQAERIKASSGGGKLIQLGNSALSQQDLI